MAFTDTKFQLGMMYTQPYRSNSMSRTKDLYETVENLVYDAIEQGANNTHTVYDYVTQYVPQSIVTYNLVEKMIEEYSTLDYESDNVY